MVLRKVTDCFMGVRFPSEGDKNILDLMVMVAPFMNVLNVSNGIFYVMCILTP